MLDLSKIGSLGYITKIKEPRHFTTSHAYKNSGMYFEGKFYIDQGYFQSKNIIVGSFVKEDVIMFKPYIEK